MLTSISLIVGSLGAILLIILFIRLMQVEQGIKLKRYRSRQTGFVDLLNYASVIDDGIIANKNGSLMAAWVYSGKDLASSSETEREDVSTKINRAFTILGSVDGWMLHIDAVRRIAPGYPEPGSSSFPDVVSAAIDQERRELFQSIGTMYEGYFIMTATYFPPKTTGNKLLKWFLYDDDTPVKKPREQAEDILKKFKGDIAKFDADLSTSLHLTRLLSKEIAFEDGSGITHDDFLRWLQYCATGINQPIALPKTPIFIDALIGGQDFYSGTIPRIGNQYVRVVAIDGTPAECTPGILAALGEIGAEYRWSTRFIFIDQNESVAMLIKYRRKWQQKVRGFIDQLTNNYNNIDQDAQAMVDDANTAITEANSGLVAYGLLTSNIIVYDKDRAKAEKTADQIRALVARLGFGARIEEANATDAFIGTLPGHGVENVRRPPMHTLHLADLIPTSTIWAGENYAPCPFYPANSPALMQCVTHGNTPFRFNLHVRDLGHTLMFGPPGTGKSTAIASIAAQFRRYDGMTVYSFDKGGSLYPMAAAIRAATGGVSGLHFDVGGDEGGLAFAPLRFLDSPGDRAWAAGWIEDILVLNDVVVTPGMRNAIATAIQNMHDNKHGELSNFGTVVQDELIRETLKPYTVDGNMGHLLDASVDGLALSDFTVFEIENLLEMGEKFLLPVLLYLFRRIEKSLKGQPAVILLDEAWIMLGHPVFRSKIKEWLKVLRKSNCIVLLATQSLSDASNSGILDVLVEATASKIFLPNIYARDKDVAPLYQRMGLNARQIEIIANAQPKREYYFVSEQGRRLFQFAFGPFELAFVGHSSKDDVTHVKTLEAEYGHEWLDVWLVELGLPHKLEELTEALRG